MICIQHTMDCKAQLQKSLLFQPSYCLLRVHHLMSSSEVYQSLWHHPTWLQLKISVLSLFCQQVPGVHATQNRPLLTILCLQITPPWLRLCLPCIRCLLVALPFHRSSGKLINQPLLALDHIPQLSSCSKHRMSPVSIFTR